MNRTLCALVAVFIGVAAPVSAIDLRLGVLGFAGLAYNNAPSFGLTSGAIQLLAEGPPEMLPQGFRPELGLELATNSSGLGAQVVMPLGVTWKTFFEAGWSADLALHALAGATLSKVGDAFTPQALLGGETEARLEWANEPGIGLGLSVGLRYTAAPWYAAATYAVWELPVRLDLEFAVFGPEKESEER
ncbi:MAG: hypothetical protein WCG80_09625 [Spirochaetales bacterium]